MNQFRQDLLRDVRRVTNKIQEISEGTGTETGFLTDECIGIEKFVTSGLSRRLAQARLEHVDAVLLEQTRQRQQGISDVKILARMSEKSRWTAERARSIAAAYSALPEE